MLLNNLEDPMTRQNLELLKPKTKDLVEEFLRQRRLPVETGYYFIRVIREILAGLTMVMLGTVLGPRSPLVVRLQHPSR